MALGFMSFRRGVDITRAIGRVGLKVEPVLCPEIARATASAIWAQNRREQKLIDFRVMIPGNYLISRYPYLEINLFPGNNTRKSIYLWVS